MDWRIDVLRDGTAYLYVRTGAQSGQPARADALDKGYIVADLDDPAMVQDDGMGACLRYTLTRIRP